MITFLNRRELICTFDLEKQAKVREILTKYEIPHEVQVSDRTDGNLLQNQAEYLIYVKKEDYDRAQFLVERNLEG